MKIVVCSLFITVSSAFAQQSDRDYVRSQSDAFWRDVEASRQRQEAFDVEMRLQALEAERRQRQIEEAKRAEWERYQRELNAYNAQKAARKAAQEEKKAAERSRQQPSSNAAETDQPQAQIQRTPEFLREFEASKAEAIRLYPDAAVNGSPLARKIKEVADRLDAQKNPIVYYSNAPLRVAQMAALELGILPAAQ